MKTKYFLLMAAVTLGLSSCQKKFDPSSYAPALNIGGYTSAKQIAPSNLVSYFAFDGSLIDSASNTAGVNTGTTFGTGIKKQSLQGALNSYVLATPSNKVAALKSFTVSEWFNSPAPSTGIIGLFTLANTTQFWGNIEIFIENGSTATDGKLRIHLNQGGSDKEYQVNGVQNLFGKWVNLTVSYDQTTSTVKVYINGSRVAAIVSTATGPLAFTNTGKFVFGTVQFQTTPSQTTGTTKQDWASFLTGQIDEVRLFDKALTDAEVSALSILEGRGK